MRKVEGKEIAGERQEREGAEEGRTGAICQSDAQSFGVRGVTHTTEPSVEATCLIMGNVCIWGKHWLPGSATEWAGKMAHLQLLLHYVSKLCTLWMATVLRASGKPQVGWLVWNVPEVLCVRQLKLREERRSFFFFNRWIQDETELQTSKSEPPVTVTL